MFSYDAGRETFVLRQFNSEGYVNRYVLTEGSDPPEQMVFQLEASEGSPPGVRARLTLELVDRDLFTETFELAMPGEELSVVLRNRWTRVE